MNLLESVAHYNNLSDKLREELTEKIRYFGKRVRYKFSIDKDNPDPAKYDGAKIYPNVYTLDPCIFDILDPYAEKGKPKSKKIAMVQDVDEKGIPNKFKKLRVKAGQKGIIDLELTEGTEDFYTAMYLELCPKLEGGMFQDKTKVAIISRIDDVRQASEERENRKARKIAMDVAEEMNEKAIVNFADAMLWDSTEDVGVLRNKVEALAESEPIFFNDLVQGKNIELRAIVKQAVDRKLITFDPAEYKYSWTGNNQTIAMLPPIGDKNEVEKMAEWLLNSGAKADEVLKKIKSLLGNK